jgi:hypothetical protein
MMVTLHLSLEVRVVGQLEHEGDLRSRLEVAKNSDESILVNLGGVCRESREVSYGEQDVRTCALGDP